MTRKIKDRSNGKETGIRSEFQQRKFPRILRGSIRSMLPIALSLAARSHKKKSENKIAENNKTMVLLRRLTFGMHDALIKSVHTWNVVSYVLDREETSS